MDGLVLLAGIAVFLMAAVWFVDSISHQDVESQTQKEEE